jgi:phage recombination protein Bet
LSAQQHEVITAAEAKQVENEKVSLLATFAQKYGLEANNMMRTLRQTVFRPNKEGREPTNEQVAAFLIVANHHSLNPFTKEIHGWLDKWGGIVAVVGVDGWIKKINEHPQFDGMTFEQDEEKCTCTMYRKDRKHPTVHTEYLIECKRPTDPWQSHPKRMLTWKTLIQTARMAFGFAGIYDPDEAERVIAAIDSEIDVTPGNEVIPSGNGKIAPKKLREVIDGMLEATKAGDAVALQKIYGPLDTDQRLFVWSELRSWERSAIKKLQDSNAYKIAESGLDLPAWSVTALGNAKDPEAVHKTYAIVEELYAEHDQEVPLDIQTVKADRLAELGVQ